MDILRIATAGSVDDGKSTLIGRLLYETQSITKDKIEALEAASKRKGLDFTDLSLLTDGLIAEREQGITIDVAHIYFNTPNRKYIIADTPGHFEYTRNMVTGASNASVSIILIDARNGVIEQTKRHFYIASLLKMENIIVAVNKMDLVDYDQAKFDQIQLDFQETVGRSDFASQNVTFIPISSLYGENIVKKSEKLDWYNGPSLLSFLENLENKRNNAVASELPARLPIQYVIRPKTEEFHDYRAYAGRVTSGVLTVGDLVESLPSGHVSKIKTIYKFDQELQRAEIGDSISITLEDDIDVSRGNMLVLAGQAPESSKAFSARVCWMDGTPLQLGKTYFVQHGVNIQKAKLTSIDSVLDIERFEPKTEATEVKLNEIGEVSVKLAGPIFSDKYEDNPANGAFIFIDPMTNGTVGLGFMV